MDNKIFIITTFHNIKPYIMECLDSIRCQKYTNWECIMIDNCSDDGTYDLLPHDDSRFKIIRNEFRNSPLMDDHNAFIAAGAADNDIILVLCGDDRLIGEYALSTINSIYRDNPEVMITHGQYVTSTGLLGHQQPYNELRFDNLRLLGPGGWHFNASHIKSFKFRLYRELLQQDPDLNCYHHNGEVIDNSADVYYMTPLMEIAGFDRVYFSETPLYWWRIHESNEVNSGKNKPLLIGDMKKFDELIND